MRQDGLFSGAQDLNSVLTNSNNMYGAGLPEGSEPWYQQPEWQEFSDTYKDYTTPTNVYQNRISQSYGTIGNILKDNGIGDFTFDLFTDAKKQQENPNVPAEGTITETGPNIPVEKDSASAENIVDILDSIELKDKHYTNQLMFFLSNLKKKIHLLFGFDIKKRWGSRLIDKIKRTLQKKDIEKQLKTVQVKSQKFPGLSKKDIENRLISLDKINSKKIRPTYDIIKIAPNTFKIENQNNY